MKKALLRYFFISITISILAACSSDNNSTNTPTPEEKTPIIYTLDSKTIIVGQKITLTGKYFGSSRGTNYVTMNDVQVTSYDIWNDTIIKLFVPSGITTGKLKVVKGSLLSNEIDYTLQQTYSVVPMVLIPKGSFLMGTDKDINFDDNPQHKVNITYDFYMSKYEISQEIWQLVYGKTSNPSHEVGTKLPVDQVTWFKAIDLCNQLSKIEKLTPCYTIIGTDSVICNWDANGYRLPTEAEWEYACRAGTTSDYYGNINDIAWTNANANNHPKDVGTKSPNAFGIYDLSGNVYEWCWDYYDVDYYSNTPSNDPKGPSFSSERVLRGGSWIDGTDKAKSYIRFSAIPSLYNYNWGVRVVRKK